MAILIFSGIYSSWIDRTERKLYGVKPGVKINGENVGGFLPGELEPVLDELAIKCRVNPRNPFLDFDTGAVIPEVCGQELDVEMTTRALLSAVPNSIVIPITKIIPPPHSASELENLTCELGSFSTWFYGSWQRYENILLACRSINHKVIWPGETFSFNEAVGPRTPERGFRPAPVIGGDGIGIGGGICQVSSTVFNAAREAGLNITEHHNHSKPVPYVKAGMDATVVYGAQDLKIKNQFGFPVIIMANIIQGKVTVFIIGRESIKTEKS